MACPACGGSLRRMIAPGLWECTSISVLESGGPGLADPAAGPAVIRTEILCKVRYQERPAGGSALCACSTFAIGLCSKCRAPVCGDHSRLVSGERLCQAHAAKASEAVAPRVPAATGPWVPAYSRSEQIRRLRLSPDFQREDIWAHQMRPRRIGRAKESWVRLGSGWVIGTAQFEVHGSHTRPDAKVTRDAVVIDRDDWAASDRHDPDALLPVTRSGLRLVKASGRLASGLTAERRLNEALLSVEVDGT